MNSSKLSIFQKSKILPFFHGFTAGKIFRLILSKKMFQTKYHPCLIFYKNLFPCFKSKHFIDKNKQFRLEPKISGISIKMGLHMRNNLMPFPSVFSKTIHDNCIVLLLYNLVRMTVVMSSLNTKIKPER